MQVPDAQRGPIAAEVHNEPDVNPVAREEPAEFDGPWVPLFNGKDLAGWKAHPDQPGNWRVDNGILIGTPGPKDIGYLFTERGDFRDFHLRAEVQISHAGNSGIVLRCPYDFDFDLLQIKGQGRVPSGYVVEIAPPGGTGAIAQTGSIHRLSAKIGLEHAMTPPVPAQTWFTLDIIARGNRLITKVNGAVAVDYVDTDDTFRRGHIALQALHPTTQVHFRRIDVKEPRPAPQWVKLFNGKDTAGWMTRPDPDLPGKWRVEDGLLTCTGAPSYLFTGRGDYEDFRLKVTAKINARGDSGVFFRSAYAKWYKGPARIPAGYEAQISVDVNAADRFRTGSLLFNGALAKVEQNLVRPDEWFTLEVVAEGRRIRVQVDGQQVVDFTEDKNRPTRGHVALQHFGPETVVHFRTIEIMEVPPAEPGGAK